MTLELQFQIKQNPTYKKFLRENSSWYKYLNRSPEYFKEFIYDMKDKYKLKTSDKFNKMLNNIGMLQSFLDVLK